MNSTYYTPKLEEFHNGFEYEHYMETLKSWIPETFFMNDAHINIVKHVGIQDENTIRKVRVKCLDEDDLLELGFKTVGEVGEIDFYEKDGVGINLCKGNTSIFMTKPNGKKLDYIFLGKLLNKSELVTILNRIEDEQF